MARAVRIEFAGAMYHVMARGNRREAIVRDDEDRRTFERTLGAACERAGFRVHAYALMTNHYHLLLETPEANLSVGMGWLQNAFTRRINTRHRLWGRLFGDRYKAVVVEPGNYFSTLMDYLHLNPVRAGLVNEADGIESYRWSSLRQYLSRADQRPPWIETQVGFAVAGCTDSARGRREFLHLLESRVDWRQPRKAGTVRRDGEAEPELSVGTSLRRGWVFGSQEFRDQLLTMATDRLSKATRKRGDGYGAEVRDHGEAKAKMLLNNGLAFFGLASEELGGMPKTDWRKGVIAEVIQRSTTMRLDWIRERLAMGARSVCCRTIRVARAEARTNEMRQNMADAILGMPANVNKS